MAVTWKVVNLDYTKSLSGKTNVVTDVHWKAEDVKTSGGKSYPAMEKGSVSLDTSDLSSYTAYDDVTEENAVGWAKDALGSDEVTAVEERIASSIDAQENTTTGKGKPWLTSE